MKRISLFTLIMAVCLFFAPAAMAADTIPIGAPMPMTGWAAGSGSDYFKGVEMAVNEINKSGGLLGKQLEIIRFDSKGFEPEVVTQAADYLCGQKKVTAVFAGPRRPWMSTMKILRNITTFIRPPTWTSTRAGAWLVRCWRSHINTPIKSSWLSIPTMHGALK
jgi:hypothetical protein